MYYGCHDTKNVNSQCNCKNVYYYYKQPLTITNKHIFFKLKIKIKSIIKFGVDNIKLTKAT